MPSNLQIPILPHQTCSWPSLKHVCNVKTDFPNVASSSGFDGQFLMSNNVLAADAMGLDFKVSNLFIQILLAKFN